jgi:hypothetical protein
MPATIFSSASEVKSYGSNLSLNDVTKILSVSGNPASGAGTAAPVGSIALDYSNGKTYKKTGSLATEWAELGSGVGGINYIVNPDAESGTTGWSTYADAAGAQPVDGTGGTPNVTWTRSTTTPLRGTGDFNFVKDAVNRQGQGVSYDVTVDNADLARVLTVSFDYEVVSGTYATGDLTVYLIQDPTGTPVVIQPAGYQVVAATAGNKMTQIATFQTDSSQKSYRLCFHIATTSALDYTLALDNIVVGPTQKVYGAPVTDWISYTPTIGSTTGSVTNATAAAKYRRVGDSIEGEATITFSAASAAFTGPNITLPAGLFGDTSKITNIDTDRGIGICSCLDDGSVVYGPWVVNYASTTNKILAKYAPTVNATSASTTEPVKGGAIANNFPFTFGANDKIFISWKLPILGWSSNVEVSSSTDTRVVAARADRNGTNQTIATNNTTVQIQINSLASTYAFDSHGAFNTSTYNYVAPLPGYYRVTGTLNVQGGNVLSTQYTAIIRVDGTDALQSSYSYPPAGTPFNLVVSGIVKLNAGQTVGLWFYGLGNNSVNTLTLLGSTTGTVFQIERLSGPSQIAASETVAASYSTSAGQSIPHNAYTPIIYATKQFDTHGMMNTSTGVVTIPISGKYLISTAHYFSTAITATATDVQTAVVKNSVAIQASNVPKSGTSSGPLTTQGTFLIQCLAGDTITINLLQANSTSTAQSLLTNGVLNFMNITRVGN